jgi:hypothetical protein
MDEDECILYSRERDMKMQPPAVCDTSQTYL